MSVEQNSTPIQYVTNNTVFYGLDFFVDERVFIPRNRLEVVVDHIFQISATIPTQSTLRVLELCTGSGAIAVSIAHKIPSTVVASDISRDALDVARINAKRHNVDIEFIQSNYFSDIPASPKFDVIIATPPYSTADEVEKFPECVRCYEPRIALCGGDNPFSGYETILKEFRNFLSPDGVLFIEVWKNNFNRVAEMFEEIGCNTQVLLGRDQAIRFLMISI